MRSLTKSRGLWVALGAGGLGIVLAGTVLIVGMTMKSQSKEISKDINTGTEIGGQRNTGLVNKTTEDADSPRRANSNSWNLGPDPAPTSKAKFGVKPISLQFKEELV
ncbi:MAG TPA: hypothetical protein VGZ25_01025, partial [Gemmataceae bacterium]|nr:hypothetical protein [Gemmataceae bacterium]